jgi:hypothetical protein
MEVRPFTAQDDAEWKAYACGSRCLIELWKSHGRPPLPREVFVAMVREFGDWFVPGQLGATTTSLLIDIARKMTLCDHADTFVSRAKILEYVRDQPPMIAGIFVLSDLNKDQKDMFHCRLLRGRGLKDWIVWEPNSDGTDSDCVPISDEELTRQMAHFLVFQKTPNK